jgi:hypothetical protein
MMPERSVQRRVLGPAESVVRITRAVLELEGRPGFGRVEIRE